ncbi:Methyltransf-25 domain-containing protein [Mycena chlorophos]|uniref:Methyltransf-25 domain-containing protein n=1 Tax=Mycena chlorophos TaxID=658473 RepID=A0A8H6SG17_MYCCL|nr:Methyltransf-25 domain-containing protein [Mycena chlorophos]
MLKRYASTTLRAQPFAFPLTGDGPLAARRTAAARFNLRMLEAADRAQFPKCFAIAAEMKKDGVTPSKATYNTLLRSLAHGGHASATLAVLDDMLAMKIDPDVNSLNFIVEAHRTQLSPLLHVVLRRMKELDVVPNATTYTHLIQRFAAEGNLEECLRYYSEMKKTGIVSQLAAIEAIIVLAARHNLPKLAIDLAVAYEQSTRPIQQSVWLVCLQSSAAQLYAEGVSKSWPIVIKDQGILPDEGLCLLVLQTAARHGLSDLAAHVIRVLTLLEVPLEEHHFAPLFEAFLANQRYLDAFETLALMREHDIIPTLQTVYPVATLATSQPQILDDIWVALKNKMTSIDSIGHAALLQAALATQPLSRVFADHASLSELGVQPTVDTFIVLLDGCIQAKSRVYGELAFSQAKGAGFTSNGQLFGRMVLLHLADDMLDEAFRYLEQLDSRELVADRDVYEALAIRAATLQDARYLVAIDALMRARYQVDPSFFDTCLEFYQPTGTGVESLPKIGLDPVAQRLIETGEQAAAYASGRGSSYPAEVYDAILAYHQGERKLLLDVGCGPGKVVFDLLPFFEQAVGTDSSAGMIQQATNDSKASNARFAVCKGENCGDEVEPGSVSLLTVAMAAHWLDMRQFYASALKALQPGGTLAIWTCSSFYCNPATPNAIAVQEILSDLEDNKLGPYMLPGNMISRNAYETLEMPWDLGVGFKEDAFVRKDWDRDGIPSNGIKFISESETTLDQLEKGFGSASAVVRWRAAPENEGKPDVVSSTFEQLRAVLGDNAVIPAAPSVSLLLFRA